MSKKNIAILQNILKKQNRYDLAVKLDNSYYIKGYYETIDIFVHPHNYLELQNLTNNDRELLIAILRGFDGSINQINFMIDKEISITNINDIIYIFVDEAGDMDFSVKGSKHYMFNFLIKKRPFNLHEYISNYRYSILERNLDPLNNKRIDIESFHACEDNKYIKEEIFKIISTFDKESVQSYSYILEKPKVEPEKRNEKDKFYIDNLSFAIQKLLDKLTINKSFIIITDRLPVQKNKDKQVGALKKGIKEYLKKNNLKIRYDIFHHCSASSVNLQIIDYISWAIFRKYEKKEEYFYKKIDKYLIGEDLMTKNRKISHYEK